MLRQKYAKEVLEAKRKEEEMAKENEKAKLAKAQAVQSLSSFEINNAMPVEKSKNVGNL